MVNIKIWGQAMVRDPRFEECCHKDHLSNITISSKYIYWQDTKHTLQIIENINQKIDCGEISLEGVSLVSYDVEKMYNNITRDMGIQAAQKFWSQELLTLLVIGVKIWTQTFPLILFWKGWVTRQ
jgi:hypothetical protein